jgi:hypothetical protein
LTVAAERTAQAGVEQQRVGEPLQGQTTAQRFHRFALDLPDHRLGEPGLRLAGLHR